MEKTLWLLLILKSVDPEEVPGKDVTGTEVTFVPVAVIGAVGLKNC